MKMRMTASLRELKGIVGIWEGFTVWEFRKSLSESLWSKFNWSKYCSSRVSICLMPVHKNPAQHLHSLEVLLQVGTTRPVGQNKVKKVEESEHWIRWSKDYHKPLYIYNIQLKVQLLRRWNLTCFTIFNCKMISNWFKGVQLFSRLVFIQ